MVNKELVGATLKVFEDILTASEIPYAVRDDEETVFYRELWESLEDKENIYRQAAPAIRRIATKEPYIFKKDGEPLVIRLNYLTRELERDSFGEIMLERPDIDWRFSISIKDHANVLATMPLADRDRDVYMNNEVSVFNEIDDFGSRIFGIPCSNDYFDDMNEILMRIDDSNREKWNESLADDAFVFKNIITPMLGAMGREMPRICEGHPEAPKKLIDYFYGSIDYYFIKPIEQYEVTRIGCVNSHGGLGRIPGTNNHFTPVVEFPTQLLDVRFATGEHGTLSRDTIQFTFDGGWAVCVKVHTTYTEEEGRFIGLNVFLPVTPFGSYRDQVEWDA